MSDLVNLSICGSEKHYVKESALDAVPVPEKTRSYQPVTHKQLFDMVSMRTEQAGLKILQSVHALARKGQRYFGMMQVEVPSLENADMGFIIGVRNSYDKSVPAGLVAGNQIFLCSNGMFTGEEKLSRRHTTNVWADLPSMIVTGIQKVLGNFKTNIHRMEAYKSFDMCNAQAHDLIAKAYLGGAISQKQVASVIEQWHRPNHTEFKNRNMYSLHNAFTEVWKENTPHVVLEKSNALHPLFDREVQFMDGLVNVSPAM